MVHSLGGQGVVVCGDTRMRDGHKQFLIFWTSPDAQHTDLRLTGANYHTTIGGVPVGRGRQTAFTTFSICFLVGKTHYPSLLPSLPLSLPPSLPPFLSLSLPPFLPLSLPSSLSPSLPPSHLLSSLPPSLPPSHLLSSLPPFLPPSPPLLTSTPLWVPSLTF